MTVRDERQSDATSIRRVVERAFGQVAEANLVERLRLAGAASISLVAVEDSDGARAERDEVIGHILFSPVTIEERMPTVPALSVNLPHYFKGTHMSRFIEILDAHCGEITMRTIPSSLGLNSTTRSGQHPITTGSPSSPLAPVRPHP